MKSRFLLLAFLAFVYVNVALVCVAFAASFRLPSFVTFFLVCMPFALVLALVPAYLLKGAPYNPQLIVNTARLISVPLFIAGILVEMGVHQQATLSHGPVAEGIEVREALQHSDAVAFEFLSGRGRSEFFASAVNTHGRTSDTWYVVPFVAKDWSPAEEVTVWALSLGSVQKELDEGLLLAGMVETDGGPLSAAKEAIATAIEKHSLKSSPNAVILRMDKSLAEIRSTSLGMTIIGFFGLNFVWAIVFGLAWRWLPR